MNHGVIWIFVSITSGKEADSLHQADIELKLLLNSMRFTDVIWLHRN